MAIAFKINQPVLQMKRILEQLLRTFKSLGVALSGNNKGWGTVEHFVTVQGVLAHTGRKEHQGIHRLFFCQLDRLFATAPGQ